MKWQGRRGSGNVEDRRGMGGRGIAVGGVGGGVGIVILLVVLLLGGDPRPSWTRRAARLRAAA